MIGSLGRNAGAFLLEVIIAIISTIAALEAGPVTLTTNVDEVTFEVYPLSHELTVELVTW